MQQLVCSKCGVVIASSEGAVRPNSWQDASTARCEADMKTTDRQVFMTARSRIA